MWEAFFFSREAKERAGENREKRPMEDEEHEVYGGEIPDVAEMDADGDINGGEVDGSKVSSPSQTLMVDLLQFHQFDLI